METIDPATNTPLPKDAIQRILFIASKVHVYNIPPLTSTKGYVAASWTENNNARQIFTARLRILETAIPDPKTGNENVKTDILLEDPASGQLFAAAPYSTPAVVEQVLDSSRFFAVRVQGEGGRKAVLGIGFEDRSEAFDFSVGLQEVRKVHGMDAAGQPPAKKVTAKGPPVRAKASEQRDFSLKEGETITINIGGKGRRHRDDTQKSTASANDTSALFSIAPPPPSNKNNVGTMPFLPPPPSAGEVRQQYARNSETSQTKSDAELGFDDGEFGEFQ